jgi:phosphate transport system substrate-binding protein
MESFAVHGPWCRPLRYWVLAILAVCSLPVLAGEAVVLGGVGSLTPAIRQLAEAFHRQNPDIAVSVVEPPLGSFGSMRALAAGRIDIAVLGRPTRPEEGAAAFPWLETPLVLATNGGRFDELGRREIADVYAGRRVAWPDGRPLRLVLRGAHESELTTLRTMSPEIDAAVGIALRRVGLPIAENDLDALDLLTRMPGSFGTTSLGLISASGRPLTVLPIDGVRPSLAAMADGTYPWRRTYFLVTGAQPSPATRAFRAYLTSPAAAAILRRVDYAPVARP